jgi:hypothetical protein
MASANVNIVFVEKEHRRCGLCQCEGHNRRTCPQRPQEQPARSTPVVEQATPTTWYPGMFTGGGVKAMPPLISWQPGTDSLAFHQEMRTHPFYSFDASANAYRRR